MKEFDTMSVSKVGQSTLPKWWRDASGLSAGGVVEVRPVRDGKNSILLTPKESRRRGAAGLFKLFTKCPAPILPPERHEPAGVQVIDPLA
jgi:bifunctional DNA-binding transcriptional regulator/antitoxin component of YhaV-PrlF toxin-antitoxin module